MKLSLSVYRRMLFIYAAAVVVVALVLVLGVIGPVKDEVSRGGTPEVALKAFWVNIGFNLISALILIFLALGSKGRSLFSTISHIIFVLVVLILGLTLVDAASAYLSHGPAMRIASILLFVCASIDLLAGVSVFVTVFLQPKKV